MLGLLTLILFVLTIWLWPRLAGRTKRAMSGRIGLLAVCQLALVATVLATGNAYFGFYTSWKDLLGLGSQSYTLTNKGDVNPGQSAAQLASVVTSGYGAQGTVVTAKMTGSRSGIDAQLSIYLPPQYNAADYAKRDFPAVVVDAAGEGDPGPIVAKLLAQGNPAAAVVVVVSTSDNSADQGSGISCSDVPGGMQGDLFWGQDLRTAINARYRVGLGADDWGAVADAQNGTCPVTFALEDADRYSAAAVLGAWQPPSASGSDTDPAWYLKTFPAPPSRLLFSDLGRPVSQVLPGVRSPLQVTTATGMDVPAAVTWLTQTLEGGAAA
ncbi:MAG TPA: hypothetical protein VGM10_15570 [Actinocrinis sp.]